MSQYPFTQAARLETRRGEYVQTVQVPKFVDSPPEIVNWGERFFVFHAQEGDRLIYREGLMVHAEIWTR